MMTGEHLALGGTDGDVMIVTVKHDGIEFSLGRGAFRTTVPRDAAATLAAFLGRQDQKC